MISLKRYLDADTQDPYVSGSDADALLPAVLQSYRDALLAMGQNGARAHPAVGSDLQRQLAGLVRVLSGNLTPVLVRQTQQQVEDHLRQWGGAAEEYFKAKTNDIKELLIVLARTAESVGERDQRYASRFTQFTSRLQAIADLEDLTQVRASLVQRATELKACVEQMDADSHQSLARLHAELSTYETKLREAEELALRDPLTGLANRRNVEQRIAWRVAHGQTFSVAVLDLNRFKQINDRYGHSAGDNLLQQFSQELSANVRCSDLVGRWSGDEFIVVLDSDLASAEAQMDRMRKWVLGDYTIHVAAGAAEVKVCVDASVGVAQWQPGEGMAQVIERADAAMYAEKKLSKQKNSLPRPKEASST